MLSSWQCMICHFFPSSRMIPPQNIDMSFVQQDLLIGGIEAAEACSDLGVTHIVTVDNVVPETSSYSSVVKSNDLSRIVQWCQDWTLNFGIWGLKLSCHSHKSWAFFTAKSTHQKNWVAEECIKHETDSTTIYILRRLLFLFELTWSPWRRWLTCQLIGFISANLSSYRHNRWRIFGPIVPSAYNSQIYQG